MEDKFKKYFIMQKAEVLFIASLIYDSKTYTKNMVGVLWQYPNLQTQHHTSRCPLLEL